MFFRSTLYQRRFCLFVGIEYIPVGLLLYEKQCRGGRCSCISLCVVCSWLTLPIWPISIPIGVIICIFMYYVCMVCSWLTLPVFSRAGVQCPFDDDCSHVLHDALNECCTEGQVAVSIEAGSWALVEEAQLRRVVVESASCGGCLGIGGAHRIYIRLE